MRSWLTACSCGVTGARRIDLPAAASGLYYKFVVLNSNSNDVKIYGSSTDDNNLVYGIIETGGNIVATNGNTAADYVMFGTNSNLSNQGDYVECFCDGTNWYFTGMAKNNNGITFQ